VVPTPRRFFFRTRDPAPGPHMALGCLEADETLSSLHDDIELHVGAHGCGTGRLLVTTKRLVWLPSDAAADAPADPTHSIRLDDVIMHAISRDTESFPKPCIYMQVDAGRTVEATPAEAAAIVAARDEGAALVNAEPLVLVEPDEVRLVPRAAATLEDLFASLCVSGEDTAEPSEGNFFFNDEAVMEGLDHSMKRKLEEWDDKLVIEGPLGGSELDTSPTDPPAPARLRGVGP